MSWRYDEELDDLFPDADERRLAAILASVRSPAVEPDPAFRSQLRRELMAEAWKRAEPRMPWWRRLTAPAPAAWGMASVGTVLIAAAVYLSMHPGAGGQTVVVSYNLDTTQPVAAVRPLDVTFSQPMDRSSVEQAVQISPATAVSYQWVSDHEVRIAPVAGSFAPNTQYVVALAPNTAHSQSGAVVTAAPAVFTVAPTPAPTPSPSPSASPTPAAFAPRQLGPASPIRPLWLSPATLVAVDDRGRLEQVDVTSGAATALGLEGVRALALRPDGAAVLALTATGAGEVSLSTHAAAATVDGSAGALAAGYDATGHPLLVTPAAAGSHRLQAAATAAWVSPRGGYVVYQAGGQLRTLELATGRDTAWTAAATFLGWAPDEKHVLYSAPDGLWTAAPDGTGPIRLSPDSAVAADWSPGGTVAFASSAGVAVVSADGTGYRVLGTGGYQSLAWAADARTLAVVQGGTLGVAAVPGAVTMPRAGVTADDAAQVTTGFMKARVAGQADAAQAYLGSGGQAAYAAAPLVYTNDPRLERWFAVATLPGPAAAVDVRLVLADAHGRDVAQLDEVLRIARDGGGKLVVDGATVGRQRPYGAGPEVIGTAVSGPQVRVQFDSDLAPNGAADAVQLRDASGKVVATATLSGSREVSLTAPAAGSYRLAVLATLRDKNGRPPAAEFALDITTS